MLETDDVDDDYFTPSPNASLASIFQKKTLINEKADNDSLKYVAPKASGVEENKTECILACALTGFEWYNNVYTPKGKLGFAVIKYVKTKSHSIVLYDEKKNTLSLTNITHQLQIKVKENVYISYYDNAQKYWSLYGNSEDLTKILNTLNNFNVIIDRTLTENESIKSPGQPKNESADAESDSDATAKRNTKASLISRMANMGHAILPPQVSADTNYESSDGSVIISKPVPSITRHKILKSNALRNKLHHESESSLSEIESSLSEIETHSKVSTSTLSKPEHQAEQISTCNYVSQLLPISNTPFTNDLNILMSEQRMNNSEIRTNIGRLSDKVDQVLSKINNKEIQTNTSTNCSTNFTNDIYQKLMNEYENKIKYYEKIIKTNNIKVDTNFLFESENSVDETDVAKSKTNTEIEELTALKSAMAQELEAKDKEITKLKTNIDVLKEDLHKSNEEKIILTEEIKQMTKESESSSICQSAVELQKSESSESLQNIVKNIMNDTFQNVSENFEDNNNYSGNVVKCALGAVMKKVTLDILNKL